MYQITVNGVHDGLVNGVQVLKSIGEHVSPRGMETLEAPMPVATTYTSPRECVLGIPERDANVFFHLFEALWILAGRNDTAFLDIWNKQMKNYSDDGKTFHAAYGYRLRGQFGFDQFKLLHDVFKRDPETRQGVLTIWSPVLDLNQETRDLPCNDFIFVKVRSGELHMRVFCRSNDIIWGCYGTNMVQFSFIQQYLANRLGMKLGTLTQFSDSFHAYCGEDQSASMWHKLANNNSWKCLDPYLPGRWLSMNLVKSWKMFDVDVKHFCDHPFNNLGEYSEPFLRDVAVPMAQLWRMHQEWLDNGDSSRVPSVKRFTKEFGWVNKNVDWIAAGLEWVERRES